jgi:hypothetical protein
MNPLRHANYTLYQENFHNRKTIIFLAHGKDKMKGKTEQTWIVGPYIHIGENAFEFPNVCCTLLFYFY